MRGNTITNILLLCIALLLLANLFVRAPQDKAVAETFKLDDCITAAPGDKPAGYLHVVAH